MALGFELAESVRGRWHRFDDPLHDRSIEFRLKLSVRGLRKFARDRRIAAIGTISAEGLVADGMVTGTVTWRLVDQNRVPYALTFTGEDGATYSLRGQRDFFVHNAIGSLTTMAASLYDGRDAEIGRAVLHFQPKLELPALLKSFRPHFDIGGEKEK